MYNRKFMYQRILSLQLTQHRTIRRLVSAKILVRMQLRSLQRLQVNVAHCQLILVWLSATYSVITIRQMIYFFLSVLCVRISLFLPRLFRATSSMQIFSVAVFSDVIYFVVCISFSIQFSEPIFRF